MLGREKGLPTFSHVPATLMLPVTGPMAKRADFTIEPDLMKGEIDEHGKLREPFVRLPGEPDH